MSWDDGGKERVDKRLGFAMPPGRRMLWAVLVIFLLVYSAPAPTWGWGGDVHRLVNRSAVMHLPPECTLFIERVGTLEQRASDADRRKRNDPNEGPRHYIDIDDYPEFFSGTLPHELEAMLARYGARRVQGNGVLPWAIDNSFEALVELLEVEDWNGAIAVAADIGHYVADLHNPLHLTVNYDGQLSGQRGIHSRYESRMTSRHLGELVPEIDEAMALHDPLESVFDWIDVQYAGLVLILDADREARAAAGSTSSTAYYDHLWEAIGDETRIWIHDASVAVASLWYTAWLRAYQLPFPQQAVESSPVVSPLVLAPVSPNPFASSTQVRFQLPEPGHVRVTVHDAQGRLVRSLLDGSIPLGGGIITWSGRDDDGAPLASGVYFVRLQHGDQVATRKAVLVTGSRASSP
jgi:hypothetical protein